MRFSKGLFFYARVSLAFLVLCMSSLTALGINTTEYRLPNGLKILVREDHRSPVVLSSIWYKVGGSYEHDGMTGLSHMLEHMMFTGTKQFGPGVIDRLISQNGGVQNATTDNDYTVYYQQLTSDKLALSFQIESDRMKNLILAAPRFAREKKVVMEERRQRVDDNPQARTWERFNAAAHVNNPYHHMTVGWMNDIQNLTLDNLKDWYQDWYKPNNATLIVVGDVQPAAVFELAKKYFGPLSSSALPIVKPRKEIEPLGLRTVIVNGAAKLPWLVMGYNVPALGTLLPDQQWKAYALYVAAFILGGENSDSSRFSRDLIRGKEITVDASAQYEPYRKYDDLFVMMGTPAPGHQITELQQALQAQVDRLKTTLVSDDELNRVKTQIVAANIYEKDSLMNQAFDLGSPEVIGLTWKTADDFVKNIQTVTPLQIKAVAAEYLLPNRLTVGYLCPAKT
jgi:zinc protease